MSNKTIVFFTLLVAFAIGVLFLVNFTKWLPKTSPEAYLQKGNIRSVTLIAQEKKYPLDVEQEALFIRYINRSVPVERIREGDDKEKPTFQEIIIERIQGEDIILTPILYVDNDLIFSAPQWTPHGYMLNLTDGYLKDLINQALRRKREEQPAISP